ncbi:WD-40 repeat-containing protein MSI5-like, partial [Musa acuminata AAA Group]|uniref:WD-40 repeat-containing protein MSI5-like n=1 Tax=Musa acuminata AAA Group TaxID=214697 RepID=UPI0031E010C3
IAISVGQFNLHVLQYDKAYILPSCICFNIVLPTVGKDKSVVLWSIHDHISSLSESLSKSPVSSTPNSSGKQPTKAGNVKSSGSPTVGPRGVYQGHEDTVEDVQFCPSSAQEFCSVGDDPCHILWDAFVGTSPAVKVEKAHNADLHCVDWNPLDQNLILIGGLLTEHQFLEVLLRMASSIYGIMKRLVRRKKVLELGCLIHPPGLFFQHARA